MPVAVSRRPGTAYLATEPRISTTAATAKYPHAVAGADVERPDEDRGQHEHGAGQHGQQDADQADQDGDRDEDLGDAHTGQDGTTAPDTMSGAVGKSRGVGQRSPSLTTAGLSPRRCGLVDRSSRQRP